MQLCLVDRAAAATPMFSRWPKAWAFNLPASTLLAVQVSNLSLCALPHPAGTPCKTINLHLPHQPSDLESVSSTHLVHVKCMTMLRDLDGMQVFWHVACHPTRTVHPTLAQQPTQAESEVLQ